MILLLNEWIIHDLKGDNGDAKQEEAILFLLKLIKSDDKIIVRVGSPWWEKAYKLMKESDPRVKYGSSKLHSLLRDSIKCELVEDSAIRQLPSEISRDCPEDDIYLIETLYVYPDSILLSTDNTLIEFVKANLQAKVNHRDNFINTY